MTKQGKTNYADDRRIEITAYMGPRRAGKRKFNEAYGNPRDNAEGYASFWTDEVFADYKAAGMTFLIPEGDAFYGTKIAENGVVGETEFEKSDLFHFLQIAERHGLPVYPSQAELMYVMARGEQSLTEADRDLITDMIRTLRERFPHTVKGILLTDEPFLKHARGMTECVELIRRAAPEWDIFASMLPLYGHISMFDDAYTDDKYKDGVSNEEKEAHYRAYIRTYGRLLGEFSFDYYALNRDAGDEALAGTFYRNLELAAHSGKEHGFPISATLQACRMDRKFDPNTGKAQPVFREVTYEDVRWQAYSALAFGARRLGWFTFWQHYNESVHETFPTAMVVYDEAEPNGYRKTAIYEAVKKVNAQIAACDHVFLRFDWQGCRTVNVSNDENIRLVDGGFADGCLLEVTATRDTLVGCFENAADGRHGYWAVNAHNPYYYEWNEVELQFADATHVQYWRNGREYTAPLANGRFHIRLGAGEGVFVIPFAV